MPNSCMETKEDFVLLFYWRLNHKQLEEWINDTKIGRKPVWCIFRGKIIKIGYLNFLKKTYDNEVIMEETWSRVEADLSLLKMTTTCPGDNNKFWYICLFCYMPKKTKWFPCERE